LIIDLCSTEDISAKREEAFSRAGVPESGQSLTIWAGRALACARYTQDPTVRCLDLLDASGSAGVLSRGVGLRGFESHPPHQQLHCTTLQISGTSITQVYGLSERFLRVSDPSQS
jgi:hypothetical protein